MKKVLTLFLVVCMLLSVIPMTVSAEAIKELSPTAPESLSTVVYVGSIETEYTPDGTREKPYKNLKAAYDAAIQDKTEGDIKIVVLNDIFAVDETSGNASGNYSLCFAQYIGGTVYICGERNEETGSYPAIDFQNRLNPKKATLFTLGADTVFYDLVFDISNTENRTLWLNAALYNLTMGRNISRGENMMAFDITGSCWNTLQEDHPDERNDGAVINIYSGTYSEIYAGPRSSSNTYTINTDITLNVFGGTVTKIWGAANSTAKYIKGNINVNIHNVTFEDYVNENGKTQLKTLDAGTGNESATINLNLDYCYEIPSGLSAKDFTSVNRFGAKCVGVQNTDVAADNTYSVRFVGVVDSFEYDEIGFKITGSNGKTYDTGCKKLYSSIVGDGVDYEALKLGGNYIFAVAIIGIPKDFGEISFTVTPYTLKGETYSYGTGHTVIYNAGEYISCNAVVFAN